MLIARLIADPATLETRLSAAIEALQREGLPPASSGLLNAGSSVVQIELASNDAVTLRRVLDAHFPQSDGLIVRDELRIPDLFVSDMDSTMIGQECIDELADFAGLKPQISAITERAMRGELEFEPALRERVGLLAGLEESVVATCLAERIRPMEGARTLVATLKAKGCRTVLVTGGFDHFAEPVAADLGFERFASNRFSVAGGKLTGGLEGAIMDSAGKKRVLAEEAALLGENAVSLATGDGANDIPMLAAATYGMAFRAKPKARAAGNGWIDRGDLTAILRLLEIPESEWVAG